MEGNKKAKNKIREEKGKITVSAAGYIVKETKRLPAKMIYMGA